MGGSFAAMVHSIFLIGVSSDSSETASKSEKPAKQEKVVKETPEQKAVFFINITQSLINVQSGGYGNEQNYFWYLQEF